MKVEKVWENRLIVKQLSSEFVVRYTCYLRNIRDVTCAGIRVPGS